MSCDRWNEQLVAALYDELNEAERNELDLHLAGCADCRREMDELAGARDSLRLAEPHVPYSPRVVVLESPRRRIRSWWSFAAGFACASLLLCAGLVAGWQMAQPGGDRTVIPYDQVGPDASVPAGFVTREELTAAMTAQEQRLQSIYRDGNGEVVSPGDLDTRLSRLENGINQQRRNDLRFVLQEILASELRAGSAIDETQQAVRYLAVANQPGLSEW